MFGVFGKTTTEYFGKFAFLAEMLPEYLRKRPTMVEGVITELIRDREERLKQKPAVVDEGIEWFGKWVDLFIADYKEMDRLAIIFESN
jgi:hypothetical protein